MAGDANRNLVAALTYLPFVAIIISVVIFLVEKDDRFIRFHALQSFVMALLYYVVVVILNRLPLGDLVSPFFAILMLVAWLLSMYRAYQGQMFKWPIVGNFAEKQVGK